MTIDMTPPPAVVEFADKRSSDCTDVEKITYAGNWKGYDIYLLKRVLLFGGDTFYFVGYKKGKLYKEEDITEKYDDNLYNLIRISEEELEKSRKAIEKYSAPIPEDFWDE